jgi:hypothetical protein
MIVNKKIKHNDAIQMLTVQGQGLALLIKENVI